MRAAAAVVGILLFSGCGGGPREAINVSGPGPTSVAQAFDCVGRQLDDMGYVRVTSNADAGVIEAERRNDEPWWRNILGIHDTTDRIVASVSRSQPVTLQVSAATLVEQGGDRAMAAPADRVRDDSRLLLASCAPGA